MRILIIPTIREIYKGQCEKCVDIRLINFIEKIFRNSSIEIYNLRHKNNYDLIILAGGNNSILLNKADKIRNRINNLMYSHAIKNRIKIIGICHGAHFLAKKLGFALKKKRNHKGFHEVIFKINNKTFKKTVNSYHNETIVLKKKKNINVFAVAGDKTIEAFHSKNNKVLGLMWHPERYKNDKILDKKLIKNFYATNSIISR
jgi:putative glutamine amidotransferase